MWFCMSKRFLYQKSAALKYTLDGESGHHSFDKKTNLDSMSGSRPKTIGIGPAQVGATAAMALALIKPFLTARIAKLAA